MKYERFMHRFFRIGSGVSLGIAGIAMLKGSVQSAIFAILLAIHLNMLSWNYEDYDEEE